MKKTNKKAKIITVIAIVTVIVFTGILIATNEIKNNNVNNESYLATANANSDLVASYIKSGVTIGGITGTLETIDVSNATATAEDVLEGKTFYAGSNEIKTGTMTNNGDWSTTINPGESINIPQGYHSGNEKVTANQSTGSSILVGVIYYNDSDHGDIIYTATEDNTFSKPGGAKLQCLVEGNYSITYNGYSSWNSSMSVVAGTTTIVSFANTGGSGSASQTVHLTVGQQIIINSTITGGYDRMNSMFVQVKKV